MAIDPKYHRGAEASSLSRVEVHSLDIAALEGIVFRQALQALQEASRPLSMPYPSRLTNEQVAELLGVSLSTVNRWTVSGKLTLIDTPAKEKYDTAEVLALYEDRQAR